VISWFGAVQCVERVFGGVAAEDRNTSDGDDEL